MVTCREVRDFMNRAGARLDSLGDLPPEISSHLTSCTSCLADRRVAWLRKKEADTPAAEVPSRTGRTLLWTAAILIVLAAAWYFARRS